MNKGQLLRQHSCSEWNGIYGHAVVFKREAITDVFTFRLVLWCEKITVLLTPPELLCPSDQLCMYGLGNCSGAWKYSPMGSVTIILIMLY